MRALLILLSIIATTPLFARDFLAERIGSAESNSVPVEIKVIQAGKNYEMRIVGKDDIVGALVTQGDKSYNVRLLPDDLDDLALLNVVDSSSSNSNVMFQVRAMRDSDLLSVQVSSIHDAAILINKIITIFNLPEYRVQHGETLSDILKNKFKGAFTIDEVLSVNPGLVPDRIRANHRIKIPKKKRLNKPPHGSR